MQKLRNYNIDHIIATMRNEIETPQKETGGILEYFRNKVKFGVFTKSRAYFEFLKNTVLKSNNIDDIIKLAQADIPHVSFREIEKVVKKSHNAEWYVKFIKSFPQVNRREYEEFILNSGNLDACTNYAIYCKPKNIRAIQDLICDHVYDYNNRKNLIYFFKHVEGADRVVVGKTFVDSYFDQRMDKHRRYPLGFCKEGIYEEIKLLFDNSRKRKDGVLDCPPLIDISDDQKQNLQGCLREYVNSRVSYYDRNVKIK